MNRENLGPAERVINAFLTPPDHMFHNRPGTVTAAPNTPIGVRWEPAVRKVDKVDGADKPRIYRLSKQGAGKKAKTVKTLVGNLWQDGTVRTEDRRKLAEFREAGIFPEVAAWCYQQVAEVWKLDNEFAARWASYAFADKQTSRDLKVVLAAFMLCQSRRGDPIKENGTVLFLDDDFRNVGEAMALLPGDFNVKLLLRIREVLELESVAQINRELSFGRSERSPHLGRWPKVAAKWLRFREQNPKVLDGLIKSGFRKSVKKLAKAIGYKPTTPDFFRKLRWEQKQSSDGRRALAIGEKVEAGETWAGLNEQQVCERIMRDKPTFKRLVGLLPDGLTRAIVMAAIEAGSFSDKDLIIFAPTLEELGLHKVQEVQTKLAEALRRAEDQRAANIARNVQSKEMKEVLEQGADNAVKAAVAEVTKGIRVYFMVDISGSMTNAIEQAKKYLEKFLGGFPPEQIHISVFNTSGREVVLRHASAAGVTQAFKGIAAGGGTSYAAGIQVLQKNKPKEDEDVLFVFVGDEQDRTFAQEVRASGLNPMAFGFIKVSGSPADNAVRGTAVQLGIPCFMLDEAIFADPYAIPRTVRALIAATPVGQATAAAPVRRVSLVDQILRTDLLKKPVWADAVL